MSNMTSATASDSLPCVSDFISDEEVASSSKMNEDLAVALISDSSNDTVTLLPSSGEDPAAKMKALLTSESEGEGGEPVHKAPVIESADSAATMENDVSVKTDAMPVKPKKPRTKKLEKDQSKERVNKPKKKQRKNISENSCDKNSDGDKVGGKSVKRKRKKKDSLEETNSDKDGDGVDTRRRRKRRKNKQDNNEEDTGEQQDDKKKKKTIGPQRKNIRQLRTEKQLENSTLDAQKEEMERKKRLDELRAKLAKEQAAVSQLKKPQSVPDLEEAQVTASGDTDLDMDLQNLLSAADKDNAEIIEDDSDDSLVEELSAGLTCQPDSSAAGPIAVTQPDTCDIDGDDEDDMEDSENIDEDDIDEDDIDEDVDQNDFLDDLEDLASDGMPSSSSAKWSSEKANSNLQSLLADDSSSEEEISKLKTKDVIQKLTVKHIKQEKVETLDSDEDDCVIVKTEEREEKDNEVITLSSGEEDEKEDSADEAEDENNSGSHVNDLLNMPDEKGRILVNMGHPKEDKDIFLAGQVARAVKPHQVGGIRFLYDNVVESLDRFQTTNGFGCILAHSMGLGKTLQVIGFVDVFLRHTPGKHVLIIVPVNTLQNWIAEFNQWLPPKIEPKPEPEDKMDAKNSGRFAGKSEKAKTDRSRSRKGGPKKDSSKSRGPPNMGGMGSMYDMPPDGGMGMYGPGGYMPPYPGHHGHHPHGPSQGMPPYSMNPMGYPPSSQHHMSQGSYGMMGPMPPHGGSHGGPGGFMNQLGGGMENCNMNSGMMGQGSMGNTMDMNNMSQGSMGMNCNPMDMNNIGNRQMDMNNRAMNINPGNHRSSMDSNMSCGSMSQMNGNGMPGNSGESSLNRSQSQSSQSSDMSNFMNPDRQSTGSSSVNPLMGLMEMAGPCPPSNELGSGMSRTNSYGSMNDTATVSPSMGPGHNNIGPGQSNMGSTHNNIAPGHSNMGPGHTNMPSGHSNMGPGHSNMSGYNNSSWGDWNNYPQHGYDSHQMQHSRGYQSSRGYGSHDYNMSQQQSTQMNNSHAGQYSGAPAENVSNVGMSVPSTNGPNQMYSSNMPPVSSASSMGMPSGNNMPPASSASMGMPPSSNMPPMSSTPAMGMPSGSSMPPASTTPVDMPSGANMPPVSTPSMDMSTSGNMPPMSSTSSMGMPTTNSMTPSVSTHNMSMPGSVNQPGANNTPVVEAGSQRGSSVDVSSATNTGNAANMPSGDSQSSNAVQNILNKMHEDAMRDSVKGNTNDVDGKFSDVTNCDGSNVTGKTEQADQPEASTSSEKVKSSEEMNAKETGANEDNQSSADDKDKKEEAKDSDSKEEKKEERPYFKADENPDEPPGEEKLLYRKFKLFVVNDNCKTTKLRGDIVGTWSREGGVLLMGYEMYRLLVSTKTQPTKARRKRGTAASKDPVVIDVEEEEKSRQLLADTRGWLTKSPGPDLVICDEGHRIKNAHASISQALKNIKTKRRVVLTGYPLQNNLIEYWCMVDFVRPNYLGTRAEFGNMFERPISNGQCNDSTYKDVKLMKFRAHVLHKQLEGFVQRRGHAVLKSALPPKTEYVIQVRMTPIQQQLYKTFIDLTNDEEISSWANQNILKAFSVCCKIWNHPDILHKVHKKGIDTDLDLDEVEAGSKKKSGGSKRSTSSALSKSASTASLGTLTAASSTASLASMASAANNVPPTPTGDKSVVDSTDKTAGGDSIDGKKSTADNGDRDTTQSSTTAGDSDKPVETNSEGVKVNGMEQSQSPSGDSGAAVARSSDGSGDKSASSDAGSSSKADDTAAAAGKDELLSADKIKPDPDASPVDKAAQVETFEWANDLMKDYVPGLLEHGSKMVILMTIIKECLSIGEKLLVFSQSLLTLNLIEEFLSKEAIPTPMNLASPMPERWAKNHSYFRLDGSTSSSDREKMINLFNAPGNNRLHLFLLSTRAGCLGINLIGANRVVVFDASWNPCHDSQAVCRVYRYGQQRDCHIYRLVMDNTMERKIYNRQVNKQGMSDRVVDEYGIKNQISQQEQDLLHYEDATVPSIEASIAEKFTGDPILRNVITQHHNFITCDPYPHESLLIDSREHRLTKLEKRLAQEGYEREKKMGGAGGFSRPSYSSYTNYNNRQANIAMAYGRPMASVRPIISTTLPRGAAGSNLPLNTFLKPGVSLHQVKTTTDITIPGTNTSSDSGPSKIPAGETVLVIKTPRGVYIRTPQGKIFAVRAGTKGLGGAATTTTASTSGTILTTSTTKDSAGDGKAKTVITVSASGAQQLLGGSVPGSNVLVKSGSQISSPIIKTIQPAPPKSTASSSQLTSLIMSGKLGSASKPPVTLSVKPSVKTAPKIIIPANMLPKQKQMVPVNVVDKASGKQLKIMIPSALLAPTRREEMRSIIEAEVKKLKAAIALEKAQNEKKKQEEQEKEQDGSKQDGSKDDGSKQKKGEGSSLTSYALSTSKNTGSDKKDDANSKTPEESSTDSSSSRKRPSQEDTGAIEAKRHHGEENTNEQPTDKGRVDSVTDGPSAVNKNGASKKVDGPQTFGNTEPSSGSGENNTTKVVDAKQSPKVSSTPIHPPVAPVTAAPVTAAPVTAAPVTAAPVTDAMTTTLTTAPANTAAHVTHQPWMTSHEPPRTTVAAAGTPAQLPLPTPPVGGLPSQGYTQPGGQMNVNSNSVTLVSSGVRITPVSSAATAHAATSSPASAATATGAEHRDFPLHHQPMIPPSREEPKKSKKSRKPKNKKDEQQQQQPMSSGYSSQLGASTNSAADGGGYMGMYNQPGAGQAPTASTSSTAAPTTSSTPMGSLSFTDMLSLDNDFNSTATSSSNSVSSAATAPTSSHMMTSSSGLSSTMMPNAMVQSSASSLYPGNSFVPTATTAKYQHDTSTTTLTTSGGLPSHSATVANSAPSYDSRQPTTMGNHLPSLSDSLFTSTTNADYTCSALALDAKHSSVTSSTAATDNIHSTALPTQAPGMLPPPTSTGASSSAFTSLSHQQPSDLLKPPHVPDPKATATPPSYYPPPSGYPGATPGSASMFGGASSYYSGSSPWGYAPPPPSAWGSWPDTHPSSIPTYLGGPATPGQSSLPSAAAAAAAAGYSSMTDPYRRPELDPRPSSFIDTLGHVSSVPPTYGSQVGSMSSSYPYPPTGSMYPPPPGAPNYVPPVSSAHAPAPAAPYNPLLNPYPYP